MVSFLDALGQTANFLNNDPSFQREEMYYRGIDPVIVENRVLNMQKQQQEQQEQERKQSLAQQIMERGADLTPQEIMAIGAQDAELGKLAANVFLDGQKQQTMQPVTLPNGTVLGYDKYSNTVTPAGRAGQPVDEMNGASPMGEWEAEKARIKANAPLTKQQIIENERQTQELKFKQQNADAAAEKAAIDKKANERTTQGVYDMLDTTDQALNRLLSPNSGVTSATGFIQSKLPTIREKTKEAENDLDLVKSLRTLGVAEQEILKGVLSDTDMKLLIKAGSGALDFNRRDETVINELKRIKEKVSKAKSSLIGGNTQPTTQTKPSGTIKFLGFE